MNDDSLSDTQQNGPRSDKVWASNNYEQHAGVLMKDFNIIWNAAIEAAASIAEINSAADIRKLKK
jgi:hypothetical protein